jgi:hypothetical protein
MAVVNRNASIEFIVKPKQDLYLEGSLRRLPRVGKGSFVYLNFDAALDRQLFIRNTNWVVNLVMLTGEAYPCQMQKNQTFSCLFRHYAKHNGLCKDGKL